MIKNEIEAECMSNGKSTWALIVLRCISGPHLVILAWKGDKLSYGRAQNGIKSDFNCNCTQKSKVDQPPNQKES